MASPPTSDVTSPIADMAHLTVDELTSHPSRPPPTATTTNASDGALHDLHDLHDRPPLTSHALISAGKRKAQALLASSTLARPSSPVSADRSSREPSTSSPRPSHHGSTRPHRPRPTLQERQLDQYITRDHLHSAALAAQSAANADWARSKRDEINDHQALRRDRRLNPATVFEAGYVGGASHGPAEMKTCVIYPAQRPRPGRRRNRPLRVSRADMAVQADQIEELVPIRLDIDEDSIKLRDTFTWNLHERLLTPDHFAEQLVEDFGIPAERAAPIVQAVARSVSDQLQDFYPHIHIDDGPLDPHLPYHAYKNDDMRILVKLNIIIGRTTLVDQFEWDINCPLNSPEAFAAQMSRELSLTGEFTTAIAHCIREQSQLFTRSLYVTGHPFDGRPVEDADLRDAFLPSPPPSILRTAQQAKEYGPYVWDLNDAELERAESSLSREQRRQKRSVHRRGGPALPDLKDRPRTVRTQVVSSVIPSAATTVEESRLYKRVDPSGSGRSGRRAGLAGRGGDDDDSDLSDSDDSAVAPDPSPAPPASSNAIAYGGTRTRGVRGAASAAQAAMRATYGRSATPELSSLSHHHHETRTSGRRAVGARETTREDSLAATPSLMVILRISPARLRQLERRAPSRTDPGPTSHVSPSRPVSIPLGLSQPPIPGGGVGGRGFIDGAMSGPATTVLPGASLVGLIQPVGAMDATWPPLDPSSVS